MKIRHLTASFHARSKLTGFSTERLIEFLNALGRDVEIEIFCKCFGSS